MLLGDKMDYFIVFLRTLFFYFVIFVIYRIMGKREVGQLGIIDLIVSILIAELVVISIENYKDSVWYSLVPIITLTALQVILALITMYVPKIRNFLDGNPSVIIKNGILNYKEMVKQKYNLDDLLVQLREKGYRSIEEIEYAILENNGSLSVFPNSKNRTPFPFPIIVDGEIQEDTVKNLHKNKNWIISMLKKKEIDLGDVFYAFYKDKSIFIIKNSDLK